MRSYNCSPQTRSDFQKGKVALCSPERCLPLNTTFWTQCLKPLSLKDGCYGKSHIYLTYVMHSFSTCCWVSVGTQCWIVWGRTIFWGNRNVFHPWVNLRSLCSSSLWSVGNFVSCSYTCFHRGIPSIPDGLWPATSPSWSQLELGAAPGLFPQGLHSFPMLAM